VRRRSRARAARAAGMKGPARCSLCAAAAAHPGSLGFRALKQRAALVQAQLLGRVLEVMFLGWGLIVVVLDRRSLRPLLETEFAQDMRVELAKRAFKVAEHAFACAVVEAAEVLLDLWGADPRLKRQHASWSEPLMLTLLWVSVAVLKQRRMVVRTHLLRIETSAGVEHVGPVRLLRASRDVPVRVCTAVLTAPGRRGLGSQSLLRGSAYLSGLP